MSDDAWRRLIRNLRRIVDRDERERRVAEALRRWRGSIEPTQQENQP